MHLAVHSLMASLWWSMAIGAVIVPPLQPTTHAPALRFELLRTALPAEAHGSTGTAWIDVDGDGRVDVAIGARDSFPSRVFRNTAGGFVPVAVAVNRARDTNSLAWGDVDGDGDPDLVLGQDSLALYETRLGDGRLELAAATDAGDLTGSDPPRGGFEATAFGDLDADGDLDLVAGSHGGSGSFVLYNDGRGRFTSAARDLFPFPSYMGAAQIADLDADGRTDVLFTGAPLRRFRVGSFVYWNEASGEWSADRQTAFARHAGGLGSSLADVDDDGDLDLFLAGWREDTPSALYLNDGGRRFRRGAVVFSPRVIGSGFADFDSDGDLDLVVSTGYTDVGRIEMWLGDGAGGFVRAEVPGLTDVAGRYAGLSIVDLDVDGRPDIAVASTSDALRVFRNASSVERAWLQVGLRSTPGGVGIWGTRVELQLEGTTGRTTLRRTVNQQTGYGGHGEPVAHFGIPAGARIARITLRWSDGQLTTIDRPASGRRVTADAPRRRDGRTGGQPQ